MLRISSHIEQLLRFNDCVIIPDFGGFVLQTHPAVYNSEKHTFAPPYKETVFNPTLKHNDGLLPESYMQAYHMDFNEAQLAVKSDVDMLKKGLELQESVSVGEIGVFRKQEDSLLFEPNSEIASLSASSYGLVSFYLPPVQAESEETVEHPAPLIINKTELEQEVGGRVVYLPPINKILSRVAGVAAAAIALFLLISTPVKDVNQSAYTASFIPSEMVPKYMTIQKGTIVNEKDEENEAEDTTSSVSDQVSDPSLFVLPTLVLPTEQPFPAADEVRPSANSNVSTALPIIETVVAGTYYIVIASLDTDKDLNKFFAETALSELKNVGIVKNNKRIRIYADKTTNRKDAEAYMRLLRDNETFKDAWLFIGR